MAITAAEASDVRPEAHTAAAYFDQEPDLTEYICHWARRVGCIYVETPKVACTTIKRVLQAQYHIKEYSCKTFYQSELYQHENHQEVSRLAVGG